MRNIQKVYSQKQLTTTDVQTCCIVCHIEMNIWAINLVVSMAKHSYVHVNTTSNDLHQDCMPHQAIAAK